MIGRRRRGSGDEPAPNAGSASEAPTGDLARAGGPFDLAEIDAGTARKGRVDLGGLIVPAVPGMKLQFRVDEKSGKSGRVMVVADDAAVELIAIAAPRSSGMWEQTRAGIMADAQRNGGKAEEAQGPFGTELRVLMPATTPDGKKGYQPSRIAGVDGPRWMLRATFVGGATTNAAAFAKMVEVVRGVIVVRGDRPMPPGDVIVLTPPERPVQADGDAASGTGDQPGVG